MANWTPQQERDYQVRMFGKGMKSEPLSNAPPVDEESPLHGEIMQYCRSKLWGYVHSTLGVRTTTTPGTPDFIILADNGRTFFVEVKDRQGKMSPAQLAFKVQAEMNGHKVYLVRSMTDFLAIL